MQHEWTLHPRRGGHCGCREGEETEAPESWAAYQLLGPEKCVQENILTQRLHGTPRKRGVTLLQIKQQLQFQMCAVDLKEQLLPTSSESYSRRYSSKMKKEFRKRG